ncbi:MAG: universal stress protein, partial [Acidobacteria bacterium]|nr:universal stress protein [Acidobacteriota bacterium]
MFTRILVPIDFSATSSAALTYARALASAFNATLHLLHIAAVTFLCAGGVGSIRSRQAAMADLDTLLGDEDRQLFRATATVEYAQMPAEAIVHHALANDVELIVMGTHGHTGLAHVLLGSVAEWVVRRAPCPVLTLRGLPRSMADGRTGPSRVLAATDFSPPSDRALEHARRLAERCGAQLHLLHVLEDPIETAAFATRTFVPDLPEVREARLREAADRLAQRAGADSTPPRVTTEVVVG